MQLVLNDLKAGSSIRIDSDRGMSDQEFYEFCGANPDLRIERTAEAEIEVMPPTDFRTGYQNSYITSRLTIWAEQDGRGYAADSSTGFRLPNGATRSPDASWILRFRVDALSRQEKHERFLPLCPEFVVELRSASDRLSRLQSKMEEWIANGVQLGWLIDPVKRNVQIYGPGQSLVVLSTPPKLEGTVPVAGFELDLKKVWEEI